MSDLKIPELPTGHLPTGPELGVAVQDGQTRQFTVDELRDATTTQVDIYVHASSGADSNDGLTADTPVASLARAYEVAPRILAAPLVFHLSSGSHAYAHPPLFVLLTDDAHAWWVGDGAGDPGDDPYEVVAVGNVTADFDGGRGSVTTIAVAADDDYVGLQMVVTDSTTGDRVGRESLVRRTVASSNTLEWTADLDLQVDDEVTLRRSACYIDAPYDADDTVHVQLSQPTGRRNFTAYGYRNVTFRSLKPVSSNSHRMYATDTDVSALALGLEGFRFDPQQCNLRGGASYGNPSTVGWRDNMAGLNPPTVQGLTETVVWDGLGWTTEVAPDGLDFNNEIMFAWDALVSGPWVYGTIYGSRLAYIAPLGGRVRAMFLVSNAVADMGTSNGFAIDGSNLFGSLIMESSPSFCTIRTSRIEIVNRGTAHAIKCSGLGVNLNISSAGIPTGGASGAGARAIFAEKGAQVVIDGLPVMTGGTAGEDIEVSGETVIANAALTSDSALVNANSDTRVYRP